MAGFEREFNLRFQQLVTRTRVMSVSKRHDSLLMWAHYAQDHRGAVVEIDAKSLLAKAPGAVLGPVRYESKVPQLFDVEQWVRAVFDDQSIDYPTAVLKALSVKGEDWRYEDEWRFINVPAPEAPDFPANLDVPCEDAVRAVYCGARMVQSDFFEVRKLVRRSFKTTGVFKANKHPGAFKLEFKKRQ